MRKCNKDISFSLALLLCVWVCGCTYIHINMYMYIYTHRHTHAHTHTHVYFCKFRRTARQWSWQRTHTQSRFWRLEAPPCPKSPIRSLLFCARRVCVRACVSVWVYREKEGEGERETERRGGDRRAKRCLGVWRGHLTRMCSQCVPPRAWRVERSFDAHVFPMCFQCVR